MMLSALAKKTSSKNVLKWIFSGFSIFFIAMLAIITVHDMMTGESSNTVEYCAKYGIFASPDCW
jgi:hypothetical protein